MARTSISFILIFSSLFINAQANPPCGTTFTVSTTLTGDCDCSGYAGTAFTIGADNITFDLNGYTLTGAAGQVAVLIPGRNFSTVTNGSVAGADVAILFNQSLSSNVQISNLVLTGTSSGTAIEIRTSGSVSDFHVNNVTASGFGYGLLFNSTVQSSGVFIQNSSFNNNSIGMQLLNILGINILNISAQNNSSTGVSFQNISGSSSVANLNVSGSSTGVSFGSMDFTGFPIINPAAITFANNSAPILFNSGISAHASIEDFNLTGTSSGTAIEIRTAGSVSDFHVNNVTASGFGYGLLFNSTVQSNGVSVQNSSFNNNSIGMQLLNILGINILNISAQNNSSTGVSFQNISGTSSVANLNVSGSSTGVLFGGMDFTGFPIINPLAFTFANNNAPILFNSGENNKKQ